MKIFKLFVSIACISQFAFAAPPVVYQFTAPLLKTGENMGTRTISIPKADASHNGYLSSTDWATFSAASGASISWGLITGTLSSQTDLQAALNAKQSTLSAASASVSGYLTSTDWNTFNNKQSTLSLGNLTDAGTDGIVVTGGTGVLVGSASLSQHVASASYNGYLSSTDWSTFNNKQSTLSAATSIANGYLTSTDWSTFNNKQSALTLGNLTEATSSVLTITGGTSAIIGSGLSIQVKAAATGQNGYLSSTDWNTFNGKQSSLSFSAPLVNTAGTVTCNAASGSVTGCLSSSDWTTFNNKGSGTVTAVSVASSNGFTGSSSGGSTPALTLTTSITGVLKGNGTAISAATAGSDYNSAIKVAIVADQKSLGTDGGACNGVSANTWFTRTLQTVQADYNSSGVTVSSNQMSVPAGTWLFQCKVPQFASGNRSVAELYDASNSADKASVGCVGDANSQVSTVGGQAAIHCVLTLAGTTLIEVRQKVQTASATVSCLGQADGSSGVITAFDHETYTQCVLMRLN